MSHVSHVSGGRRAGRPTGEPREPRERGGQASRPAHVVGILLLFVVGSFRRRFPRRRRLHYLRLDAACRSAAPFRALCCTHFVRLTSVPPGVAVGIVCVPAREPRERGGQASRPAQVSHVSHVSGGVA